MKQTEHCLARSFVKLLQANEFCRLHDIAHEHYFKKGDYIFQSSQGHQFVYILLTDNAKISHMSQLGNELIQWFCMPGDIFGISSEHSPTNKVYAQAISESKVLRIKKHDFNQLMLEQPRIGLLVIQQLSSRIHALADMFLYMASDSANIRYKIIITGDLGANKTSFKIGVYDTGGLRCSRTDFNGPASYLFYTDSEIGLQAKQGVTSANNTIQTGLIQTHLLQKLLFLIVIQFDHLRFNRRAYRYNRRALLFGKFSNCIELWIVIKSILCNIGDVHNWLDRQQKQIANLQFLILI